MKFSTVVEQVLELLQRQKRISYRALKREFDLDDEYIEDLKTELIAAKRLARDEDGIVLVWTGEIEEGERAKGAKGEKGKDSELRTSNSERRSAERRQLTVMFCDLVD